MIKGFPLELSADVEIVLNTVLDKSYNNLKQDVTENRCNFKLLSGEEISFPSRIYYIDNFHYAPLYFSFTQKMIYHAIYTRSCNGFIRARHLYAILNENFPDWIIPYIIKLSDEYVVEILDIIYFKLTSEKKEIIQKFCLLNIESFLKSHDRVRSYWNAYYKNRFNNFENYVGEKLYHEYFGYNKSLEKLLKKWV